jgi:hypothetical protein
MRSNLKSLLIKYALNKGIFSSYTIRKIQHFYYGAKSKYILIIIFRHRKNCSSVELKFLIKIVKFSDPSIKKRKNFSYLHIDFSKLISSLYMCFIIKIIPKIHCLLKSTFISFFKFKKHKNIVFYILFKIFVNTDLYFNNFLYKFY